MKRRQRQLLLAVLSVVLPGLLGCSSSTEPEPPPPVPTVDLTGYFVLPSAGFVKFFTGGSSKTWTQDTVVNGTLSADVMDQAGRHEYLAKADRAWVATLDTSGFLFLLSPPLAALPDLMPASGNHVASSGFVTQTETVPVRRISRLIDTGLTVAVPAGTFDSVALIRQEFWTIVTVLGATDTTIDSSYRWFAPGVDEIRRVEWLHTAVDSTVKAFQAGSIGGRTYP
jgi:hypothetical protein